MKAVIKIYRDKTPRSSDTKALLRTAQDLFAEFAQASQRVSQDTVESVRAMEAPGDLADLLAANVLTKPEDRQAILDELDPVRGEIARDQTVPVDPRRAERSAESDSSR